MERIKYKDGYLALGEGFNDDRVRFDLIMSKRRARITLTKDEKDFARRLSIIGRSLREERTKIGFDRLFTSE